MRHILFVNTLILLMFASIIYWTDQRDQLEMTVAEHGAGWMEPAMAKGEDSVKETDAAAEKIEIEETADEEKTEKSEEEQEYIKWVDFDVSKLALAEAYEYDMDSYGTDVHIGWIDILAWTAAHTGGSFSDDRAVCQYMEKLEEEIAQGKKLEDLVRDLPYFSYYQEAYGAVLGGMVGEYEIEVPSGAMDGSKTWEKRYGLKAFHPIASGFPYSDYDDFGVSRSYGYKRNHLGHDMMGQIGTPVVCVESGYIEALGWNQYGGWRIGVRSFDKKRYYYYAHLRQGFPYQPELKEGSVVLAGDVIGYMGHTGYSATEDTNNIDQTHLHFGMQLIFDESQKDGNGEIWIDCYQIVRFLYRNQSETARNDETKEWRRIYLMKDPDAEAYERTVDFSMYP